MTRKDRDELIEKIEKSMIPSYEMARDSPYLAGKRDAYLAAITIVMEYYFDKMYSEVSING